MPLELGDYSAHICCDGKELEAFETKVEDEKTVSCWIASEEGKTFTVHWGDKSAQVTMSVKIVMDGRVMASVRHTTKKTGSKDGVRESTDRRRPWVFTPLVLIDDDSLEYQVHEDLGVILIEMRRVKRFEDRAEQTGEREYTVENIGPVHERSKKSGTHAVGFGSPVATYKRRVSKTVGITAKEPFAIFKFRYRPLALLQANGIAPPSTTAAAPQKRAAPEDIVVTVPSFPKRPRMGSSTEEDKIPKDEDLDDADDVTAIREQLEILQRRLARAEASQAGGRVKREVSPIRLPSSSTAEVIDLTDL